MSKKRDPLISVIQYFNTVDLVAASQALTMAREIVRSRQPRLASDGAKKKATPKRRVEAEPPLPLN